MRKNSGVPGFVQIVVSDTQAYKQFGNSVVVPLMTDVAGLIVEKLKRLDGTAMINDVVSLALKKQWQGREPSASFFRLTIVVRRRSPVRVPDLKVRKRYAFF